MAEDFDHRRRYRVRPYSERFWNKVRVTPGCWLWTGLVLASGYGQISIDRQGKRVHRVSYEIHSGPIPSGLSVCHSCDVRLCVNPDHLWLGTTADNQHDKAQKGRSASGERNGGAKLKVDAVVAIRNQYAAGDIGTMRLARQYGVHKSSILRIVHGRNWSDA